MSYMCNDLNNNCIYYNRVTMKRILTTLVAVIAVCFCASAQQKGEQSLGAYFGYDTGVTGYKIYLGHLGIFPNKQEIKVKEGHNIVAAIEYSYFVANNLRLSATVGYGLQANPETPSVAHSLTISPGIAYYVRLAPNFYYTPNLSVGFACGVNDSGTLGKDSESMSLFGLGGELQPLAVEFRPTRKFAMSVSLCSLQGAAMEGTYNHDDLDRPIDMSGMNVSFDLLANAQVGFKLYF